MNKLIIFLFFVLFCVHVNAQSAQKPSNFKRFGLDYSLKNLQAFSNEEAEQLDIDQYESLRNDSLDIEVFDVQSKKTIILFSKIKVIENERKSKVFSNYFQDLYIREK